MGGNFCGAIEPPNPGDCDPYWVDQQVCEGKCQNGSWETITCDSGECEPAASGEFTGPNAGSNCMALCGTGGTSKIDIFCKGNNPGDRTKESDSGKIATAIGCIPITSTGQFTKFFLGWGMGITGGIALILIVVAGFQIITSGGNPQKLNAGKELLTAAVMGIVLLLFGMYLLRLIGVDILNIPEFG